MLSSYSPDGDNVDKMAAHVDDIVFRPKAVVEFLSKDGIRAKSINDKCRLYGEYAHSYRSVRHWVEHFNAGATDFNDNH